MVGGHRIAQQRQHPGAVDILDHRQRSGNVVEKWRMLDVGGIVLPYISGRLRYLDGLPLGVAGEHLGILLVEHRGIDAGHGVGDFPLAWPDVAQVHRLAIFADTQRFAADIDAHAAGQGIGDHQRR
ncbi:hypothetical protein D3C77_176710 [compost metagenome]